MPDLREIWWSSVKGKLLVDRDTFMRAAEDWTLSPIYVGQELAAILLNQGSEIHLIKLGKHAFLRSRLRDSLVPLLDSYGSVLTRVETDDVASQAFVKRLGFFFVGSDGYDKFYRLEKLRHV